MDLFRTSSICGVEVAAARGAHAGMFQTSPISRSPSSREAKLPGTSWSQVADLLPGYLSIGVARDLDAMSFEQVDAIGQGRVWTGEQAVGSTGSSTSIGGLRSAVAATLEILQRDRDADGLAHPRRGRGARCSSVSARGCSRRPTDHSIEPVLRSSAHKAGRRGSLAAACCESRSLLQSASGSRTGQAMAP